jgi:hypothetical protein
MSMPQPERVADRMAKAASHLAMSQSAISESIAHLEDAIRVRLLDRTPQGIAPTIYAETLLKRGHVIFDELQQAINLWLTAWFERRQPESPSCTERNTNADIRQFSWNFIFKLSHCRNLRVHETG